MLEMLYVVALIAGGGLVFASSIAGGFGADVELDTDAVTELGADDLAASSGFIPFFQFKFWTFFAAFFGLTGFLLLRVGSTPVLSVALALVMGLVCGMSITWALERLKQNQRGSLIEADSLLGQEALVRTAIHGQMPGKVRLLLSGRAVDYIAVSDSTQRIEAEEAVVVVAIDGPRLRVLPRSELIDGEKE